jgi:hypothetical protein
MISSNLPVRFSSLGGNTAVSYIIYEGDVGGISIDRSNGNVTILSPDEDTRDFGGVVLSSDYPYFFYEVSESGTSYVFLAFSPVMDDSGGILHSSFIEPSIQVELGIWDQTVAVLDAWIRAANEVIGSYCGKRPGKPVINASESSAVKRAYTRGYLLCYPGNSFRSIGGSTEEKTLWMEAIAKKSCEILNRRRSDIVDSSGSNVVPFSSSNNSSKSKGGLDARFMNWPTNESWEHVFNRVLDDDKRRITLRSRESITISGNCSKAGGDNASKAEICFEFAYLSDDRSYKFDVVRIGALSSITMFGTGLDKKHFIYGMFDQKDIVVPTLLAKIEEENNADLDSLFLIYTIHSTVSDEIIQNAISSRLFNASYNRRFSTPEDAVRNLPNANGSAIILADQVLSVELQRIYSELQRIYSKEHTISTKRPREKVIKLDQSIPVGFIVDRADLEWQMIITEATQAMIAEGGAILDSWRNTLSLFSKAGIEVDDRWKLEQSRALRF